MGAALARAFGLCMRGAFSIFCAAEYLDAHHWRVGRGAGPPVARVGFGAFEKKRSVGDNRALCLHAQSTLSWKLSNRTGFHDRGGPDSIDRDLSRYDPGHLSARNARRIGDPGRTIR